MNIEKFLGPNFILKKYPKGKTNQVFISNCGYIVKKYSNITINNEAEISKLVKDFDVPLITVNKKYKITKFIAKSKNLWETPLTIAKTKQIAKCLKKFHNKKIETKIVFKPTKIIKTFINKINTPLFDFEKHKHLISKLEKIKINKANLTLCHNDLQFGNWLFSKNKLYLIDWEYAGMNDPVYDVTSFLSENIIFNTKFKEIFLNEYFGKKEIPWQKINLYHQFISLFWALWANMMYEIKKDEMYYELTHIMLSDFDHTKKDNH